VKVVRLQGVWKTYWMGRNRIDALRGIDFELEAGEMVAVMGPSGSGKSTMLNLLGCLDKPSAGRYLLGERDVSRLSDASLSRIRASQIGFIFQSFNLIPQLNVVENIEIPLFYQGVSERESHRRAAEIAARIGLGDRLHHLPTELSGGQMQRVAIARALVSRPLILLADEPTGNLDTKTGAEILSVLEELNREDGATMVLVPHDPHVAGIAHRAVHIVDGQIQDGAEG